METRVSRVVNSRHTTTTLSIAIIFIFMLATMRCWIGFEGRKELMIYVFPVVIVGLLFVGQIKYVFKKRYFIFSVIMAITSLLTIKGHMNFMGHLYQIWPAIGIFFVLSIPDNEKEYVLEKIIRWFCILMILSISLYVINLLVQLPSLGTIQGEYSSGVFAGEFLNYIFYTKPIHVQYTSFTRFNGPFIEPGDVGCAAAFILMAARFDFNKYKYLWASFLGLALSFSLAGYMLALFAYGSKFIYENKAKTQVFVWGILVLISFYFFGTFYRGGDNFINETIISRLQFDADVGFVGNNRTSLLKMEYFFAMFNDPQTLWFGYDEATIERLYESGLGAGFINQAVVIGMAGMIGLVLPYLYFALTSSSRKYGWMFFVLFLLYFFQRSETQWLAIVMPYVYGIRIFEMEKNK